MADFTLAQAIAAGKQQMKNMAELSTLQTGINMTTAATEVTNGASAAFVTGISNLMKDVKKTVEMSGEVGVP